MEVVGLLLVIYRNSDDPYPIRWVRLADFQRLEAHLREISTLAEEANRVRDRIKSLRGQGLSNARIKKREGIDVAAFERADRDRRTWPLASYEADAKSRAKTPPLRHRQTLQLQSYLVQEVRLLNRFEAAITN